MNHFPILKSMGCLKRSGNLYSGRKTWPFSIPTITSMWLGITPNLLRDAFPCQPHQTGQHMGSPPLAAPPPPPPPAAFMCLCGCFARRVCPMLLDSVHCHTDRHPPDPVTNSTRHMYSQCKTGDWCGVVWCGVVCRRRCYQKAKGRDVYPRVQVNGLGCVCCVRAVRKCVGLGRGRGSRGDLVSSPLATALIPGAPAAPLPFLLAGAGAAPATPTPSCCPGPGGPSAVWHAPWRGRTRSVWTPPRRGGGTDRQMYSQCKTGDWCGVVWCGVVWCGVVWCGVVWCGVVWCGVVWCGVVWCGVVWCGVVWCGVVWC